jgi:hypothetical protein
MVDPWLQKALWGVYRPGQEVDKIATPLYCLVQTRCRIAIATKAKQEVGPLVAEARRWFALEFKDEIETLAVLPQLTDEQFVEAVDTAIRVEFS